MPVTRERVVHAIHRFCILSQYVPFNRGLWSYFSSARKGSLSVSMMTIPKQKNTAEWLSISEVERLLCENPASVTKPRRTYMMEAFNKSATVLLQ